MPSEILSVAEMVRADAAAIASGVSGQQLMANAGQAVAQAIQARWTAQPILVLCGPGNNGGDGFVVARLLAAEGWPVQLALLGDKSDLTGDAARHAGGWDGAVEAFSPAMLDAAALVVDALFGAGLSRPLSGAARDMVDAVNASDCPVVAVDLPSGLSGDSGAVVGDVAVKATLTVTFFRKKIGHLLLPGRVLCGEVVVADIGIPDSVLSGIEALTAENEPALWAAGYPWRQLDSHKYDFGHALVCGGGVVTGAGRLAARAALRVGAGLVTVACPSTALPIYALSDAAVITAPVDDAAAFQLHLEDDRKNAVLVGPGHGVTAATRDRVLAALKAEKAVVLDADALTSFQKKPDQLFELTNKKCVLTPHEGEFIRLFPGLTGDKLSRARAAARLSGAVILLKGADSVIAAPDGRAAINANAGPELATAGSGDVLAGLVVGLLAQGMARGMAQGMAQGMDSFDAACAATWLHGEAGSLVGTGLIADDLPEVLPEVLADLKILPEPAPL